MLVMNIMEMMNNSGVSSKGDANAQQNSSTNSFAKRLDDAVAGSATFKDTNNRLDNNRAEDTVKDSEYRQSDESSEDKPEENRYVPYILMPIQTIEKPADPQIPVISEADGADAVVKIGINEEQIITAQDVEITFDTDEKLPQVQQGENQTFEAKLNGSQTNEIQAPEAKGNEVQTVEAKDTQQPTVELKDNEAKTTELKDNEAKTTELKGSDVRAPEVKETQTVEVKGTEVKAPEVKEVLTAELKGTEVKAPEVKDTDTQAVEVKGNEVQTGNTEAPTEIEQPKFTLLDTAVLKTTSNVNADHIENNMAAADAADFRKEQNRVNETGQNVSEILNFFEENTKETFELTDNTFVRQVLDEANTQIKNDAVTEGYKALETSRPIVIQNTQSQGQENTETDDNSQQTTQQPKMSIADQTVNTAFAMQNNSFEARLDSLTNAQANPQASAAQNVRFQILEQVSSMINDSKQELTLQLKPHHLGGLTITLTQDQNGVTAKLVTASKDAHMLIQSEMAQMQETLRDKGIHVVEMEVIYDQMANTTGKGDSETGYNQQQGSSAPYRGGNQGGLQISTEEITWMYEDMTGIEVLAEQGGSVEFSA